MKTRGARREERGARKNGRWVALRSSLLAVSILVIVVWVRLGPLPPQLLQPVGEQSTLVLDRHGEIIYEVLSERETRSRWLAAEEVPRQVIDATVAAEDHRFFIHPGVDPIGITRAAWRNVLQRKVSQGGSTITQQVIRQLCRSCPKTRSLTSKIREAILALRLEHRLSKREILALYLNTAPYGNQIAGIGRASETYFGVSPRQLTVAQSALLAGLPQAPSRLDPYRNPAAAVARQRRVLARMGELRKIEGRTLESAKAERLEFRPRRRDSIAPHFVEHVLARFGDRKPPRIETTLDAPLQREIAGIIRQHEPLLSRHGARNVAVVVLENATGDWLAWEGSGDYFSDDRSGAIDGATAPRQPGSALKPFTYALAFEQGFSPAIALPDIPANFPTAVEGIVYTPRNYDGVYRGPLRARAALAGSENVPAVWLLSELGPSGLLQFLRRIGLTSLPKTADYYGLGLTLGNAEVRLDELVSAYAVFARGGRVIPNTPVSSEASARDLGGRFARRPAPRSLAEPVPSEVEGLGMTQQQVVSPETAFWITDILSDSRAREYIFGSGGSLDFPFQVAVKTGTSEAYRDNWTIGYTRDVTVGVWVGNFDRKELRSSSGVTGAAPIFHSVMLAALRRMNGKLPSESDPPIVARPASLTRVEICGLSGMLAQPFCPTVEVEWLRPTDRLPKCDWHRRDGVRWPSEYRAWARQNGLIEVAESVAQRTTPAPHQEVFQIVSPAAGATYWIDPTLRREFQALPLRASAESALLRWTIDGRLFAEASPDQALFWQIRPGKHQIAVTDARGQRDSITITVK